MKIARDNTSKKNIIKNIFEKAGLPENYSANLVDNIIEILILNIVVHKIFKVKNFGTFFLKRKNKRVGRNPKSKVNYTISERIVVTFKPEKNLKKKLQINDRKQN